jgi:acyl-homoserine lactone acylase PvdQ
MKLIEFRDLAQLVGYYIIYAGGRDSNPDHPTYSPEKMEFLATKLLDQKKFNTKYLICLHQFSY